MSTEMLHSSASHLPPAGRRSLGPFSSVPLCNVQVEQKAKAALVELIQGTPVRIVQRRTEQRGLD